MTLSELKAKDVVNTVDGRCIGKPMDLEFDPVDGRVTALVVPGEFSLIQLLRDPPEKLNQQEDKECTPEKPWHDQRNPCINQIHLF